MSRHVYLNDKNQNIPSVTTLINLLNKGDGLTVWANNLGLQNIKVINYLREKAQEGNLLHRIIQVLLSEEDLVNKYGIHEVVNMLQDGAIFSQFCNNQRDNETLDLSVQQIDDIIDVVEKFLIWREENNFKMIGNIEVEKTVKNDKIGGTIDLLIDKIRYRGKEYNNVILDIKSSKSFYFDYFLQLGFYRFLLKENTQLDDVNCMVLTTAKNTEEVNINLHILNFNQDTEKLLEQYMEVLLELYYLKKSVKGLKLTE
jgi:hypothetical protein